MKAIKKLIFRFLIRNIIFKILPILLFISIVYYYFNQSLIENCNESSNTTNVYLKTFPFNCENFYNTSINSTLLRNAEKWQPQLNETLNDCQMYEIIHKNCTKFLSDQNYFLNGYSKWEKNFPIAFSIMVYNNSLQVERLLRTIYRPWNYYCIHIDKKSSVKFVKSIEELIECLNSKYKNIINISNLVDVRLNKMSLLTAELNCMKELYEKYKDWKYLINLSGKEFPLKTNAELVKILKAYKGANNLYAEYRNFGLKQIPKRKMTFPVTWFKGSIHITVNRKFIEFIVNSPISKLMLVVLYDHFAPDELFFSTLNYNPQFRIPGSFIGNPDENLNEKNDFITRFENRGQYSCESKRFDRNLCILGIRDLPQLMNAPNLFANKFHEEFQPAVLQCLENWYYQKVENELKTNIIAIDENFYNSLPFVINQYVPPN